MVAEPDAACHERDRRLQSIECLSASSPLASRQITRDSGGKDLNAIGGFVAHEAILIALYMDGTGVGQPIVDLLRGPSLGVPVRPVYFHHGDKRVEQRDGSISLGKAWLVSRLQALLQCGCILLPKTPEARVLAQELLDYEIHVDPKANDTYGAFRVGTHDDLVTALGLAVQDGPASQQAGVWVI